MTMNRHSCINAIVDLDHTTIAERRQRLRENIARWANDMAETGYTPSRPELEALIELCQEYFLPCEAARVRRWMAP